MNKTELVKELARLMDFSQTKATDVIDAIFDGESGLIVSQLKQGDKVVIPGFGSFYKRKRDAHEARNPSTGKPTSVPDKNIPVFKPGKNLKQTCQD